MISGFNARMEPEYRMEGASMEEAPLINPGHVIELPARSKDDLQRRIDVADYFLDQAGLKAAMGWGDAAVALIEDARAALAGKGRIVINEKGESEFQRTS